MSKIKSLSSVLLLLLLTGSAMAGDKEDIKAANSKTLVAFNSQDYAAYFAGFVEDHTDFPYVVSPLRHDAAMWKAFVEGTSNLEYVNYHQQDEQIQVYNGNAAVLTAYYTFTSKPKEGPAEYQTGRASVMYVKVKGQWLVAHMHFSEMF
ncbi:MAG: nuclear transport factor 2 family protein [Woeseiaceae bacterium]